MHLRALSAAGRVVVMVVGAILLAAVLIAIGVPWWVAIVGAVLLVYFGRFTVWRSTR